MNDTIIKVPESQHPLDKALQDQLLTLLKEPITVASLFELEKVAGLARMLIETRDPRTKLNRRMGMLGGNMISAMDPVYDNTGIETAFAPSPAAETFGASIIREIVPLLKKQQRNAGPSLNELMRAHEFAKEHNDDKMQERIKRQIDLLLEDGEVEEGDDVPAPDQLCQRVIEGSEGPCSRPGVVHMPDGRSLCLECYDKQAVQSVE